VISKHLKIILVDHMDEVLSHALILGKGDSLFKKHDIPLEIASSEKIEHRKEFH